MSGGWDPRVHLSSQTGARPQYDEGIASFVPGSAVQNERSVGAAAGNFGTAQCLEHGQVQSNSALRELGMSDEQPLEVLATEPESPYHIQPAWRLPSPDKRRAFVDFQNDVTTKDIDQARRENLISVEHVKRYTTSGMGTDQGKLGNINAIGLLADGMNIAPGDVGPTSYRPPYTAMSFGAITSHEVGELVLPARRTAITDWIEARGAQMFEAGANYRRPSYFPLSGEDMESAIAREAKACRTSVGIYDGSPLGKRSFRAPTS